MVCAIPFIRPRDVLESQAGDSDTDKQQALQNAIARHYQKVFELASDKNLPTVATGHLTTVGGQMSESVRDIYIGTLSAFPVSAFPPADYIALGHLHRAQKVSDQAHIRYSGSLFRSALMKRPALNRSCWLTLSLALRQKSKNWKCPPFVP